MDKEEWIRRRAYNIWCAEGWPKGRDKAHWEQASKEVERETRLNSIGATDAHLQELAARRKDGLPEYVQCPPTQ